ncbi:MAG: class I SAM-dependent methyltransferase [Verrucomicrobiota bacterium]
MHLTEIAQEKVKQHLLTGSIAIDATAGNGHDTLFLAKQVSGQGHVYAFDIQQQAIDNTSLLLQRHKLSHVTLIKTNHADMKEHLAPKHRTNVRGVMFNLGYLPSGDKSLITAAESTLPALDTSLQLLHPEGMLSIMIYPDHPGGKEEKAAVFEWTRHLDKKNYRWEHLKPSSERGPHLVLISNL